MRFLPNPGVTLNPGGEKNLSSYGVRYPLRKEKQCLKDSSLLSSSHPTGSAARNGGREEMAENLNVREATNQKATFETIELRNQSSCPILEKLLHLTS
jgi:hypothetical protein